MRAGQAKAKARGKSLEPIIKNTWDSLLNTSNTQFGFEKAKFSKNPAPTERQSFVRSTLSNDGPLVVNGMVKKNNGGMMKFPILPPQPHPEPAEDDLYELFLKEMKDLGHDITYDDIRTEKEAIADLFKKNLTWYHLDDQTFWKNYQAKASENLEHDDTAPAGEKLAFELGVLAEHLFMAQDVDQFNPQLRPWIWQLPEDRENLVKELVKLCSD